MADLNTGTGIFKFIANSTLRKMVEVVFSSLPGTVIFFVFIIGTGLLNIFSSQAGPNNIFAATYLPVVCILPIIIGVIGPLVLERVRSSSSLSLRGSVLVSFISAFIGSFLGSLVLLISGIVSDSFKPFGGIFEPVLGTPGLFVGFLLIVGISTILSTVGGAVIVVLLNRAGS
ncbi:MAG: hypothetical protein V1822_04570 [Candidatus Micrarchaeota archaeon]